MGGAGAESARPRLIAIRLVGYLISCVQRSYTCVGGSNG
jgi:hypothetical protein